MEINKELIKNVLAKETENLSDDFTFNIKDNYILFAVEGECQFVVIIYEFAFKCKEWAFTNGFELKSGRDNLCYFCEYKRENQIDYQNEDCFLGSSEIVAIIKACEWIVGGAK